MRMPEGEEDGTTSTGTPIGRLVYNAWACLRQHHDGDLNKLGERVIPALTEGRMPAFFEEEVRAAHAACADVHATHENSYTKEVRVVVDEVSRRREGQREAG